MQGSEINFISLFLQAGPVVKTVMIGLMLASVICWAIILEKSISLWWSARADSKFLRGYRTGAGRARGKSAAASLLSKVIVELSKAGSHGDLREQITSRIALELADVLRRREAGLSVLASVASTAPFVGLFGTVWGIINSFAAIADSKNTSLAVVAPGIAEALLATAMGLLAAIPAAIFYNRLHLAVTKSLQTLEALGHEVLIRVARQQPLDAGI
jgi:biopolymer transport protein TolQ